MGGGVKGRRGGGWAGNGVWVEGKPGGVGEGTGCRLDWGGGRVDRPCGEGSQRVDHEASRLGNWEWIAKERS